MKNSLHNNEGLLHDSIFSTSESELTFNNTTENIQKDVTYPIQLPDAIKYNQTGQSKIFLQKNGPSAEFSKQYINNIQLNEKKNYKKGWKFMFKLNSEKLSNIEIEKSESLSNF
ncbi:MAG: hypothetical protein MHPSP_004229, partial [Paramarteilia canceri]